MSFTALTDTQLQRLAQLETFRALRRRTLIASVEASSLMLLADALTRRPPRTRKQTESQAALLQSKARALQGAQSQAAAARWAEMVMARARHELLGG